LHVLSAETQSGYHNVPPGARTGFLVGDLVVGELVTGYFVGDLVGDWVIWTYAAYVGGATVALSPRTWLSALSLLMRAVTKAVLITLSVRSVVTWVYKFAATFADSTLVSQLTPQFSSIVITKSIAVAAKERRFRTGVPLIFVTLTLLRVWSGDNVELTISVIVFTSLKQDIRLG
jgi:hypothetical protein